MISQRVLWGEGMFLRPQHFQQQDLFIDSRMADIRRALQIHPWGVRRVEFDRDALRNGQLRASHLEAVFQDGTPFDAPRGEPLPAARNLNDIPQAGVSTLVYASLPVLDAFGGNTQFNGEARSRPARYHSDEVAVSDLYTSALEAEVGVLRTRVQLMLEPENRDGHVNLPIARLARSALGEWSVDDNYIPPLAELAGSDALLAMLKRLLDILLVKAQALGAMHRERAKSVIEYRSADVATFWLLHTVNRNFPLINHLMQLPRAHPEELYKVLAPLAGELLTFSSTLTLSSIPPYRHEGLTETFEQLDTVIRELLETVISSRYAVIPLANTKPSFHVGRLESDRLLEDADFYLSVAGEHTAEKIIETVPLKLKVGAPDDVEKILNSALPGVRLTHAAQVPAAIPVRIGNHYFAFEPNGQIYERMLKARTVCVYVPQALPDLKLELIAVFR